MTITENLPPEYTQGNLNLLADQMEACQAEMIKCYEQALRKNLFINRTELRPRDIKRIATQEADALIRFLRNSFESARQHGAELCQLGMSAETVFELMRAQWLFMVTMENIHVVQDMASMYRMKVLEGFIAEHDKLVLKEQENIRTAFQIALNRVNIEIQEAQAIAQKAIEMSYRNIITAQEEERRRISRELHDEAGQAMVGIRMSLENLNTNLSSDPELINGIEKAMYWTDNAMQKIRSMAYSLRPPVLDLLGINLAIKQLCIDFSEQTGLIISYSGTETPVLSDELAISIYRIVQEALTNIVKHARAKHAWVTLSYTRVIIKLNILDDGQGFDPETIQTGMGLDGMQERSHLLGGKMQIESSRGRPALLKFSFPITLKMT
jgi:signal transduction histidine kinase